MAGKELSDYLGVGDYDRFHQLYHEMSEVMIARCTNIHTAFDVLQDLLAHEPEIFHNVNVSADLQEIVAFMKEMVPALRQFYTPDKSGDIKQRTIKDMERWKPYDSEAWDKMFMQQIAVVYPFVQYAQVQYEKINTYPIGSSSKSAQSVQQIISVLGRKLDVLTRWCTSDELEYMLFHPREYGQGRSPYGEVY